MPRKAPSSYPVSKDSVSKSPVTSAARKKPGSRPLSDSSTSSSTSGGTPASSVASSGPQSMEYASPPKDRPLRGVTNSGAGHSPDHDRPAPSSVGRSASGGKAKSVPSRNRSRSADDVSGGVEMSSRQQRLAAADTGEVDPSLQLAAKERFGDKVGPVVCAHLHLQGVDVEDDLRYVDAVSLVETAETSGLKKVQIIKLSDWVTQAQQYNEDLDVRFATALLMVLRGDRSMSTANLERWANKAATKLSMEFAAIKAEAETARASRGEIDPEKDEKITRFLSPAETPMSGNTSRAPSDSNLDPMAQHIAYGKQSAQPARPCLMANPQSGYRMSWDFAVIMPCLAYLTIMMPFRMCFGNEPPQDSAVYLFEMTMDFIFIFDIGVNFRTGYVEDGTGLVEYNYFKVARNYVKSWFVLDLVSGIPFGLLDMPALRKIAVVKVLKGSRILKAVKLLRFLKLSRLIKGLGIMNRIDPDTVDRIEDFLAEGFTRTVIRILRLMVIMGLMCHFMACIWVLVGRIASDHSTEDDYDDDTVAGKQLREQFRTRDSWLEADLHFWEAKDTESGTDTVMDIYLSAYYFSFTTMTTVGYGDIYPRSNSERVVTICLQCLGGFMYAYIISSLTSIVTMEDANAKYARERLDAVASYINKMELPSDLGRRVRRYFRARKAEALDEGTILMDLSPALRSEVSKFLVEGGLLAEVTIFKHMSEVYWPRILPLLRPTPLMRAEVVCREGEDCLEAFIVVDGTLLGTTKFESDVDKDDDASSVASGGSETVAKQPERRRVVSTGHMVNTLCLLKIWDKSVEGVVAAERTESYAITAEAFYETFKDDEQLFHKIQEYVVETQFAMDKGAEDEAKTEFGVPLYALNADEAKVQEERYAAELKERKKNQKKAKKMTLKKLTAMQGFRKKTGADNYPLVSIPEASSTGGGRSGAAYEEADYGEQAGAPGPQSKYQAVV